MEESRDNLARVQAFENFVLLLLYFVCYWDRLLTIGTGREALKAMHLLVQKTSFLFIFNTLYVHRAACMVSGFGGLVQDFTRDGKW